MQKCNWIFLLPFLFPGQGKKISPPPPPLPQSIHTIWCYIWTNISAYYSNFVRLTHNNCMNFCFAGFVWRCCQDLWEWREKGTHCHSAWVHKRTDRCHTAVEECKKWLRTPRLSARCLKVSELNNGWCEENKLLKFIYLHADTCFFPTVIWIGEI